MVETPAWWAMSFSVALRKRAIVFPLACGCDECLKEVQFSANNCEYSNILQVIVNSLVNYYMDLISATV